MGMICPECKTHQAQKAVFGPDMKPPPTAEDVFVIKLECGHLVGADRAREWVKRATEIRSKYQTQRRALEAAYSKELAEGWEIAKQESPEPGDVIISPGTTSVKGVKPE